jgi:ABC-2 type transport system ATP-binding protein
MEKVLKAEDLCKNYGGKKAVVKVSFEVKKGEIFALIGPNGAGKSTTLKMVATLLAPTSGTITVCGYDSKKEANKVRESISYLPEDSGAYKNLSGMAYLDFMANLYAKNQAEAKKFLEVGAAISGLGDRLKDKTGTYSKGMTRKLLLARTVMSSPALTILDEPTSGLDVINAIEIRKKIRELSKDGMAVLLSSHNMLEIEYLSDRVAIIDRGEIHETGTPKDLMKKYEVSNLEEVFEKIVSKKESK